MRINLPVAEAPESPSTTTPFWPTPLREISDGAPFEQAEGQNGSKKAEKLSAGGTSEETSGKIAPSPKIEMAAEEPKEQVNIEDKVSPSCKLDRLDENKAVLQEQPEVNALAQQNEALATEDEEQIEENKEREDNGGKEQLISSKEHQSPKETNEHNNVKAQTPVNTIDLAQEKSPQHKDHASTNEEKRQIGSLIIASEPQVAAEQHLSPISALAPEHQSTGGVTAVNGTQKPPSPAGSTQTVPSEKEINTMAEATAESVQEAKIGKLAETNDVIVESVIVNGKGLHVFPEINIRRAGLINEEDYPLLEAKKRTSMRTRSTAPVNFEYNRCVFN